MYPRQVFFKGGGLGRDKFHNVPFPFPILPTKIHLHVIEKPYYPFTCLFRASAKSCMYSIAVRLCTLFDCGLLENRSQIQVNSHLLRFPSFRNSARCRRDGVKSHRNWPQEVKCGGREMKLQHSVAIVWISKML